MKKYIFIVLVLILLATPLYAADYYIAQSAAGSGDGSNCANADAIADLTWGAGNMVSAGDTLHLCGTITSTLTVGASGSAGNPITILFEADAKFSKAVWGQTTTAAIYATSKSYITINGGTNGVIENTANGTGLDNHTVSTGIYLVQAGNFLIKDLTIQNIYVRTADSNDSQAGTKGIHSINSRNNNIVDNVHVVFAEQGIHFYAAGANADGLTIQNCDLSKVSTGIVVALAGAYNYTNVVLENNHIYDQYYWDGVFANGQHHHSDGIHLWGYYSANHIQVTIKRNIIGGHLSDYTTSLIYLEDYVTDALIYNNLLYATAGRVWGGYIGFQTDGTGTIGIYNNTIRGTGTSNTGGVGLYSVGPGTWTATVKNNIITNCYYGFYVRNTTITSDYNLLYTNGNIGIVGATSYNSIALWQGAGYDAHAVLTDPKFVSASDFSLQADSNAINKGEDLSATFTKDLLDNTRPTGANSWDIGAYEYGGAADETAPTISSATINADGDTLTLVFDEVVTVNTSTGFTLGMSGGAAGLTYTSGSGTNTLVYAITGRNIDDDETGTLDYATVANGIEDAAGNDLASTGESDEVVTNDSEYTPSATTYVVTVQSSGNCTVSPLSNQVIVSGEAASYTCTANGNSGCAAWTGTCGGTGTTSFTSSAVTGDCTVIQGCYKIAPDATIGSGAAVTLGSGAVGTLY